MIWKTIEGTNGEYQVSDTGLVRTTKTGRILRPAVSRHGYERVCLFKMDRERRYRVHRLVATAFIPNPEGKPQVNHIDGNKSNNYIDNLEWVSPTQNQQHRIGALGKNMLGENNPMYGKSGMNSPVFKGYIAQIDPKTGETVAVYAGSTEAANAVGGYASNIIKVLNKRNRTYHGYYWER